MIPCSRRDGVRFAIVRRVAETGFDFISSSKIIQAVPAVDFGLDEV